MSFFSKKTVGIIGGGPAGLMACARLLEAGYEVHLFDQMPSLGRKFLMAGKSGLNITHSESLDQFVKRYSDVPSLFEKILRAFGPDDICAWTKTLGIETFVGSSGRVFPTQSKAAPLLRSWIKKMKDQGLQVHVRHRWVGWGENGVQFDTPQGSIELAFDAYVYGLGGGSWARLGSDGKWVKSFSGLGQKVTEFRARNCGFQVKWSDHMTPFFGQPIKTVGLSCDGVETKGDFVLTAYGVEGSAIYGLSRILDQALQKQDFAEVVLDLLPDRSFDKVRELLNKPRGKKSLTTHLKGQLGLKGAKLSLVFETGLKDKISQADYLAHHLKALPLKITGTQPIDEAISTAGGLDFDGLNDHLMMKTKPGHFVCGEMLSWDAPTGGYLLTACLATGRWAANGVLHYLDQ